MEKTISLEKLKESLIEEGFIILGHGTGYNNSQVIEKIFINGLRTSHNSLFYTTIGLEFDSDIRKLQNKLDHWPHLDSQYVILIRLPLAYFNSRGESMDLNCEKTGAFVNEITDNQGKITYYLDPKFIIGVYNRNASLVTLNPHFERNFSTNTLNQMQEKLQKAILKTEIRLRKLETDLLLK